MATSGSISAVYLASPFGDIEAVFSWQRINYSIADNTSTIEWTLSMVSHGDSLFWNGTRYYLIQIHGKEYEGYADPDIASNETKVIASGKQTLTHKSDGTLSFAYNFIYTKTLGIGNASAAGWNTLDPIPVRGEITSAPNFNDEENPTINYVVPKGVSVDSLDACISFTGDVDDVPYRAISKTGTSYTFNLTDAERNKLRAGTSGNSRTVKFIIRTKIGSRTERSHIDKTFSLINYEPTLSPRVVATDGLTKELTGDTSGGTLINLVSDVSFNTNAAARKAATIDYQTIINGTKRLDDYTSNTGTIENVNSNTFYFSVTDSRGYTTNDAVVFSVDNKKYINYLKPTTSMKTGILTTDGTVTVTLSGRYFNGSFGAKKNTMDVDYSVVDDEGNYITNPNGSGWDRLTNVTPTITTNSGYTYTFQVSGLDYMKNYTITAYIVDEITNAASASKVVAAVPVFDWGKNDFRHHTPIYFDNKNGIYGTETINEMALQAMDPCNYNNNLVIGWGNYDLQPKQSNGIDWAGTNIYGNVLRLADRYGLYINNAKLADFVVEHGTSGSWYYRKWNSGRVELYGYLSVNNMACNVALGAMYRTAAVASPAYPFTVNNAKVLTSYKSQGYGAFIWHTTAGTSSQPPSFYLIRPTSSDAISGIIDYHIQGTWK